jgi:hypothetical protein
MIKRSSALILGLTTVLVFACKSETATQNNGNANVGNQNANQSTNAGGGNANNANHGDATDDKNDKRVNINITDDPANPGRCLIADPAPVTLGKQNRHKVKWCITNTCQYAPQGDVVIDDFRGTVSSGKKNPFGNGSAGDNTFTIAYGDYDCKIKSKEALSGEAGVHYKYNITIKVGTEVKGTRDPVIIIANTAI